MDKILAVGGDIVSEATLRSEDLLRAFAEYLFDHNHLDEILKAQVDDLLARVGHWSQDDDELASFLVNEDMFEALDELAPDNHYFGSHPGDGACFGYWSEDEVEN